MDNILQFPGGKITPTEVIKELTAAIAAGEVHHVLVATWGPDCTVRVAMSSLPAFAAIYMNQVQRLKIEALMRENGMIS